LHARRMASAGERQDRQDCAECRARWRHAALIHPGALTLAAAPRGPRGPMGSVSGWARSGLRAKIFVAFSALVLAVLVATLGFTQFVVSRDAEKTLHHELLTTGELFHGLLAER